jgi:Abortive infection C-terminus
LVVILGDALGAYYYSKRRINEAFANGGARGELPEGNCASMCKEWLRRVNADESVDPYDVLGKVFAEALEEPIRDREAERQRERETMLRALKEHGLGYRSGQVYGATVGASARFLEGLVRARNVPAIELEVQRAIESAERDPGAAVTAACALVEAFCKVYLHDEGKPLPARQDVTGLWKAARGHLGLDPDEVADEDIRALLAALGNVVHQVGSLRTHTGSAHGHGRDRFPVEARHARLAVHSAHSLVVFALETWDVQRPKAVLGERVAAGSP